MRIDKTFAYLAVVAGMALAGVSSAKAQDGYWNTRDYPRDVRHDARINRLQNDIARDRWRLDNDIQRGKSRAAGHEARDLAKDQKKLDKEMYRDRRDSYRAPY